MTLHIQRRPGWTEFALLPITRDHFAAHGASNFEQLFESLCLTLDAHLARTVQHGGWALVTPGELAGQVDGLDWLQYFGPRFSSWTARLARRRTPATVRPLDRGATMMRLDIDPFETAWRTRVDVAGDLDIKLRPVPEDASKEVSDEQRLLESLAPEPRRWEPAERSEMLAARGLTMHAIETGMADAFLLERFRDRYLQAGLESPFLDRIATWFPHYGQEPTIAALRAVTRVREAHAIAAPFDDEALEGCVRLVAWGGDELTLAKRESLMDHLIDPPELAMPRFAMDTWDPDVVAGLVKLMNVSLEMCQCDRCVKRRESSSSG